MAKLDDVMFDSYVLTLKDKTLFSNKRFHVTAICLDKRYNVLSTDWNSYIKTHPMQARLAILCGNSRKIYLHAEIASLVRCRKIPHTMVICRVDANNENANARPCAICMMALEKSGIKEVWYTVKDGWENMKIG